MEISQRKLVTVGMVLATAWPLVQFLLDPQAVGWFASVIAGSVGIIGLRFDGKKGMDQGFLAILVIVASLASLFIGLASFLVYGNTVISVMVPPFLFFSLWFLRGKA